MSERLGAGEMVWVDFPVSGPIPLHLKCEVIADRDMEIDVIRPMAFGRTCAATVRRSRVVGRCEVAA